MTMNVWTNRLLLMFLIGLFPLIKRGFGKVHQKIHQGSYEIGGGGIIRSPPRHPDEENLNYKPDGDIYIYILENTSIGGAIQLTFEEFYLHSKSWVTIRDGKYRGYIGRVIDRYDDKDGPPVITISNSCCLRIEFNTGCCGPAYPGSTGFLATYKYVYTPNAGRRADCKEEEVRTQLCNGECIPPLNDSCPARIPTPEEVKSRYGSLYPVAVIIAVLCTFIVLSFIVLCVIFCMERYRGTKDEELRPMHTVAVT